MEMVTPMENNKKSSKTKIIRVIAIFFALMFALTYLSRAASDMLKAKVTTETISSNTLDEGKQGTGKWVSGNTQFFTTYYGRRITNVFVRPGQTIKVGDPLFAYDVGTVSGGKSVTTRKVDAAKKALEKVKALLEKEPESLILQSRLKSAEQAVSFAEFMYAQTYAIQNGGVVLSTFSGTVLSCDLVQGKASTSGITGIEVALGSPLFSIEQTTSEAKSFAIGDEVELMKDGNAEEAGVKIITISPPDKEGNVTLLCEGSGDKERAIGTQQEWQTKKQSKPYNATVPIESLRMKGDKQYFLYVVEEKQTILGVQLIAKEVDVKVLAHDDKHAAVQGQLSNDQLIIKSSSKEIKNGDLVLLDEK